MALHIILLLRGQTKVASDWHVELSEANIRAMKKLILAMIFSIAFLNGLEPATAGLLYNYSQLTLRDLDEMNKLVQSKINESKKSDGDQVVPLKEALQAVYSRPNDDFMIDKVIQPLRSALEEHDALDQAYSDLVTEAIGALKNPKPFQPVVQVTYALFLENIIADFKPRAGEKFQGSVIAQIRDAKIEITKAAKNEHRMRVMKSTPSPSDFADTVLKAHAEKVEAEKKAAKGQPVKDEIKEESE